MTSIQHVMLTSALFGWHIQKSVLAFDRKMQDIKIGDREKFWFSFQHGHHHTAHLHIQHWPLPPLISYGHYHEIITIIITPDGIEVAILKP